MSQQFDAVAVRTYQQNGEEKKQYINLGRAFPFRDGKPGYTIKLGAMPAPVDGEYTIMLFEPSERDGGGGSQRSASTSTRPRPTQSSGGFGSGGSDGDIPFYPEAR